MTITCSTKVCSFGKQVVEKVETEYARYENGRFVYRIHRSPMCEYMINFIHKLKHLPEKYMMNSVLENFTILQVSHGERERGCVRERESKTLFGACITRNIFLQENVPFLQKFCSKSRNFEIFVLKRKFVYLL